MKDSTQLDLGLSMLELSFIRAKAVFSWLVYPIAGPLVYAIVNYFGNSLRIVHFRASDLSYLMQEVLRSYLSPLLLSMLLIVGAAEFALSNNARRAGVFLLGFTAVLLFLQAAPEIFRMGNLGVLKWFLLPFVVTVAILFWTKQLTFHFSYRTMLQDVFVRFAAIVFVAFFFLICVPLISSGFLFAYDYLQIPGQCPPGKSCASSMAEKFGEAVLYTYFAFPLTILIVTLIAVVQSICLQPMPSWLILILALVIPLSGHYESSLLLTVPLIAGFWLVRVVAQRFGGVGR